MVAALVKENHSYDHQLTVWLSLHPISYFEGEEEGRLTSNQIAVSRV